MPRERHSLDKSKSQGRLLQIEVESGSYLDGEPGRLGGTLRC